MEEQPLPVSPSLRAHRRQFAWQILIPLLLGAGMIITAALFVTIGGSADTGLWRDVSLIWMLFPALFITLTLVIVLGAAIYGLGRLSRAAPRYTGRAQELFVQAAQGFHRLADSAARPLIWLDQVGASIRTLFKMFKR